MNRRRVTKKHVSKRTKIKPQNNKYLILFSVLLLILFATFIFRIFYFKSEGAYHSFYDTGYVYKYSIRGVDVSHHNEYVNWQMLREDGIHFVFMKSTEGIDHLDREYKYNYNLAKEVGLKVGTYHFYSFGVDGKKQANHFLQNTILETDDIIPAIDVEHSSLNKLSISKDAHNKMIDELKVLEKTLYDHIGVRPIIYTNKECYRLYVKNNFPDNPLWICDLHDEPVGQYSNWHFWQFSHTGNLSGAIGDIDLNFFRGTYDEFQSMLIP